MAKKRIYEIARAEGLPSALLLHRLQRSGLDVKTASSTVDEALALHVLSPSRHPKPEGFDELRAEAQRAAAAEAEAAPTAAAEAPEAEGEGEAKRPTRRRPTTRRPTNRRPAARPAEGQGAEGEAQPEAPARPRPTRPRPRTAERDSRSLAEEAQAMVPPAPAAPTSRERPKVMPTPAPEPARRAVPEPAPAPEPPKVEEIPEPPVEPAVEPEVAVPAPEPPPAPEPVAAPEPPPAPVAEEPAPAAPAAGPAPEPEVVQPRPAQKPARSRPAEGAGGKRRRVVIDAQASRRVGPRDPRTRPVREDAPQEEQRQRPVSTEEVQVSSGATVKEVAEALGVGTAEIIKLMMGMGEMVTITVSLSDEAIELVAEALERRVKIIHAEEEAEQEPVFEDDPADLMPRAPVVTVMGHVDHGKTSLLDTIRKTEVAAGEAGGITQHIGAYQVRHDGREITFLDTPGHEAFTAMRARGAKVTDVAVVVVAADDGVMPQTVEAIDHARAAEVPFVMAINKVDRPDANPERVKQELGKHDVTPVAWGGSHEFVEVSAKDGTGIESLLETVLLVADADAEPKGNPTADASGTVIESRLDPGRGPVATVLVQRGSLRVGDILLAGEHSGRVRAMTDHTGATLESAGPSVPVEVLGLDGVPDAGEKFRVMTNEREARQAASDLSRRVRAEELANRRPVSLEDLFEQIREGSLKELNLIIKADVQGSLGALEDALQKIDQSEVRIRIILTGVGAVTESDVMLASASSAIIIAFNVRPRPEARLLAERENVDIRTYRVIYRAVEDVESALVGMLEPDIVEETTGELEVRATFRASRVGTIAGCYVTSGAVRRGDKLRLVRDGTVVHEGEVGSLRRFNDDVREVNAGFECGLVIRDYNDVKEGDVVEVYEIRKVARTTTAAAAE